MRHVPTAPLVAAGLLGGFAVGRATGRRELGGAVFAAAGVAAASGWRRAGIATTAALSGVYAAAMGASHPLAKKIGAWPAVAAVTAVAAGATYAVADRRTG
jgi:hypothetical protein